MARFLPSRSSLPSIPRTLRAAVARRAAWVLACGLAGLLAACGGGGSNSAGPSPVQASSPGGAVSFIKGADVSWVTEQESVGQRFYDDTLQPQDPFVLLKAKGTNAIRLRVWVDPAGGWCAPQDVLAKALRAKAAGFPVLVDFHYSDRWADPSAQTKPAAWATDSFSQLLADVYQHTRDTLTLLKSNGVAVRWVQVGNEIVGGMLWPDGRSYQSGSDPAQWPQLAELFNRGAAAVKDVFPGAQVIAHVGGYGDLDWWMGNAQRYGLNYDVVGISFYPPADTWQTETAQLLAAMQGVVQKYGKPVLVAEVGMSWWLPDQTRAMLADLTAKLQSMGAMGLGLFYWEPQSSPGWNGGYNMGALNQQQQFTTALDAYGP